MRGSRPNHNLRSVEWNFLKIPQTYNNRNDSVQSNASSTTTSLANVGKSIFLNSFLNSSNHNGSNEEFFNADKYANDTKHSVSRFIDSQAFRGEVSSILSFVDAEEDANIREALSKLFPDDMDIPLEDDETDILKDSFDSDDELKSNFGKNKKKEEQKEDEAKENKSNKDTETEHVHVEYDDGDDDDDDEFEGRRGSFFESEDAVPSKLSRKPSIYGKSPYHVPENPLESEPAVVWRPTARIQVASDLPSDLLSNLLESVQANYQVYVSC